MFLKVIPVLYTYKLFLAFMNANDINVKQFGCLSTYTIIN